MVSAVATRYARALADVVSKPGAATPASQTLAELEAFQGVLASSVELRGVLASPGVAPAKKKSIIARLGSRLNISRTTQNFLYVVTDHRRLALLGDMAGALQAILDERLGIVRGQVSAALPVEADQQAALAARLSQVTGRQVHLDFTVDPALLGGAVARIGSTIYDGSARGRLRALGKRLREE